MAKTKPEISRQCEECLKHIQKYCKGKPDTNKASYFGTPKDKVMTGLNFCCHYEFDVRLYKYPHKMETFKTIRIRQIKEQLAKETKDHVDIADMAAGLSSKNFEHLL